MGAGMACPTHAIKRDDLGTWGHQKFHLIHQNAAVAQYEVFPQAGHIRGVQQRHMGLLGGAVALAVVAGTTSGNDVHPGVHTMLCKRNNVFTGQAAFLKMLTTIRANIAIAGKQLAIGQAGLELEWVDVGHAPGADDARYRDDGLFARDRVVTTTKDSHFLAHFPTHLVGGVVNHRLFQ